MSSTNARWLTAATATVALAAAAGCGSSTEPTKVAMSISEQGKTASFKVPKTATGGLVELSFRNEGKAPHGVQLVRYTGDHTGDDVIKAISSGSDKTPEWIRGEGGTSAIAGGESDTATLNLPEGKYLVTDSSQGGGGPPATAEMKFTSGDTGDLPSTPGTVKAASTGEDQYEWEISGLKAGKNEITFDSEGDDTIHFILATPVKGKAPSASKLKSDFGSGGRNQPPPSYLDLPNSVASAVLDSGSSQTTSLDLKKGKYVFFCPLSDREGGKSHDEQGLLKLVTVK